MTVIQLSKEKIKKHTSKCDMSILYSFGCLNGELKDLTIKDGRHIRNLNPFP